MDTQQIPTTQELWALVQEQRARIEHLESRGAGRRPRRGLPQLGSLVLTVFLAVVTAGITYGAVPARPH